MLFRVGRANVEHPRSALQSYVVSQWFGVATRQRDRGGGPGELRLQGGDQSNSDRALRCQFVLRSASSAGAFLRISPARGGGADPVSGGVRAAGLGGGIGILGIASVPRVVH